MNKKAEKILDTTVRLFIEDGVKKITMDDIAEYSKASKVTIYKYFVDKDTLFFEVGKYIFAAYISRLGSIMTSGETLVYRLYRFLDLISDFSESGKLELCRELKKYNNAVEREYERYLQTYRQSIMALIDEGIKSGLIKKDLGKDMIYYYIDMGVVYYQQSAEYRNKMREDSNFQKQFMLFYISNIFVDGAQILSAL